MAARAAPAFTDSIASATSVKRWRVSSEKSPRFRRQSDAFLHCQQISPYFNPTYTRTGWIGQPPVLDRHEVVTIDGDVDTLRQATP